MNFTNNVAEAESSARNDGNGVRVVVDAPEVIHLRVKIGSEGGYTDSRGSVGDTPHSDVGREVQPEEEGIEFGNSSPQRVSDGDNGGGTLGAYQVLNLLQDGARSRLMCISEPLMHFRAARNPREQ